MNNENQTALLSKRAWAFTIDLSLIALFQLTLGGTTLWLYRHVCVFYGVSYDYDVQLFLSQFCGAFFFVSYFTLTAGLFGNTIGKKLLKIKVVYEDKDGVTEMDLKRAYWRSMAYLMSSWTYMIGFILPWFRKDRLALHDLLCGSRVVGLTPSVAVTSLSLLASVHPIQTPTTQPDQHLGRTGTDQ